jgi:hypothetical protein
MSRTEEGIEKRPCGKPMDSTDYVKFNCSKYADSVNVSWWGGRNRLPLSAHNICLCFASTRVWTCDEGNPLKQ